jgi:hypothetical protein
MNAFSRFAALAAWMASAAVAEGAVIDLDQFRQANAGLFANGLLNSTIALPEESRVGPGPIYEEEGEIDSAIDGSLIGATSNPGSGTWSDTAFVLFPARSISDWNWAVAGDIDRLLPLTPSQAAALIQGRLFLRLHAPGAKSETAKEPATVMPIPEPSGALGLAVLLVGCRRWRRGRS